MSTAPEPFRLGVAYLTEREVVVCGDPPDEDDETSPGYHNCDAMGCGWEHVLARFPNPFLGGATTKGESDRA